jgi:hypothetical protein
LQPPVCPDPPDPPGPELSYHIRLMNTHLLSLTRFHLRGEIGPNISVMKKLWPTGRRCFSSEATTKSSSESPTATTLSPDEINTVVTEGQGNDILFPWRKRLRTNTHNSTWMMRGFLNNFQSEHDFLRGVNEAFSCTIAAIFQHKDVVAHNEMMIMKYAEPYSAEATGPASSSKPSKVELVAATNLSSSTAISYPPSISSIFEERLGSFYERAIRRFTVNETHRILAHKLLNVKRLRLARSDFLLYSEADRTEHEFLQRHDLFFSIGKLLPPNAQLKNDASENSSPSDDLAPPDNSPNAQQSTTASSATVKPPTDSSADDKDILDSIVQKKAKPDDNQPNKKTSKKQMQNQFDRILMRIWIDIDCTGITHPSFTQNLL